MMWSIAMNVLTAHNNTLVRLEGHGSERHKEQNMQVCEKMDTGRIAIAEQS